MAVYKDVVQTRIEIEGKEALNALGKLEAELSEVNHEMKGLQKEARAFERAVQKYKTSADGSKQKQYWAEQGKALRGAYDQYQALSKKQEESREAMKKYRDEMGVTGMTIRQLSRYQGELTRELSNMTKGTAGHNELKAKLQEVSAELRDQRKELKEVKTDWSKLSTAEMTLKQLTTYQKELNEQIENTHRKAAGYDALKNKLNTVNKALKDQKDDLHDTRTSWEKLKGTISGFKDIAVGSLIGDLASQAVQGMAMKFVDAVKGAMNLSDQLTDIQKKSGLSAKEVKELNSELGNLKTRTSGSDLRDIAIVGGSLGFGKSKEELLGFVETMDKVVVSLGDEFTGGATEAGRALGGVIKLFKETQELKPGEAISRTASAMNALGNAGSALAPEMADFALRMGSLGNLAPQIDQTVGMGAALLELGLTADKASGGLTNIMMMSGNHSEAFAAQMGLTKQAFIDLLNNDPNQMILQLAESMQGLDNDQVISALQRMGVGSQEAVKVMGLLANKTDFVIEKQTLAAKAFAENTSLQKEFDLKMSNFAATMELAGKEIKKFETAITGLLVPAITSVVLGFSKLLSALRAGPQWLRENRILILTLAVAIAGLNARLLVLKATQGALFLLTKANNLLIQSRLKLKALEQILNTKDLAQRKALILASIAQNRENIKNEALALRLNISRLISIARITAMTAAQWLLNVAMNANPVGLVIIALAALSAIFYVAYQNSETFRNGVNGLWEVVKLAGAEILNLGKAIGGLMAGLATGNLALINSSLEGFKNFGSKAKKAFNEGFDKEKKADLDYWSGEADKAIKKEKKPGKKEQSQEELDRIAANKKRADALAAAGGGGTSGLGGKLDEEIQKWKDFQQEVTSVKEQMYQAGLTEHQKEVRDIELKYQALEEKFGGHADRLKQLKELKAKELAVSEAEWLKESFAQADALELELEEEAQKRNEEQGKPFTARTEQNEKRDKVKEDIRQLDLTDEQSELEKRAAEFDALILQAQEFDLSTINLEVLKQNELELIRQKYRDKELADTRALSQAKIDAKKKEFEAVKQLYSNFSELSASLFDIMGANAEDASEFQKMMTLMQIGIDTAAAISSLTVASEANPANAVTGGLAGIVQFTAGLARIMKNIASAKNLLFGQKKPARKAPASLSKGGAIPDGPSHSQGGMDIVNNRTGEVVAEMEGGEPIMVLSKDTYANNAPIIDRLLYNSMHRGGAPVVPNFDLMRRSMGGVPKMEKGGLTKAAEPAKISDANQIDMILQQLIGLRADINSKSDKMKAYVVLTELLAQADLLKKTEDDAKL